MASNNCTKAGGLLDGLSLGVDNAPAAAAAGNAASASRLILEHVCRSIDGFAPVHHRIVQGPGMQGESHD